MGKGQQFERDLCRKFSLWWSGGEDEDIFWRSQGSGARATTRAKFKAKLLKSQVGDMAAVGSKGSTFTKLVVVEMKKGYSTRTPFDVFDSLPNQAQQLWATFLCKTITSAATHDIPYWIIIGQRNRRETFVLVCDALFEGLLSKGAFKGFMGPHCRFEIPVKMNKKDKRSYQCSAVGMHLGDFLKYCSKSHFMELRKQNDV